MAVMTLSMRLAMEGWLTLLPIQEGFGPGGVCVEVVWAPHGHDPEVVCYELLVDAMVMQGICDPWYVEVGSCIVVA